MILLIIIIIIIIKIQFRKNQTLNNPKCCHLKASDFKKILSQKAPLTENYHLPLEGHQAIRD